MKNNIFLLGIAILAIVLLSSCKKDKQGVFKQTEISPAELIAPANNSAINLLANDTEPLAFSWNHVKVADGTLAFYSILVDRESGDFSDPLLIKQSEKAGTAAQLVLSRIELDSLARMGGASSEQPAKLKWVIRSGNGVSSSLSPTPYSFTLSVDNASHAVLLMTAADQLMDSVVRYFLQGMPLDIWGEVYPRKDTYWSGASTVWGQGSIFSGYAALKSMAQYNEMLNSKYETIYDDRLLTSIDQFRNTRNSGPEAYAVFPGDGDERYYDDNIWIGIDMVDLYLLSGNQQYLDRAEIVWNFTLAGTDDYLGGGVYWREGSFTGKNTCSTAPAAILGLKLYKATGEQAYLDQAKAYYAWVKENLQDPTDNTYWDNIKLSNREDPASPVIIEKNKYTYNSGTPMEAAVLLYQLTGESHYLNEAKEIAAGAFHHWFSSYYSDPLKETIQIWNDNNLWFNAVLLRGYIALYLEDGDSQYVDAYKKIMLHAWLSQAHDENTGLIDTDFTGGGSQTEWKILYQGACVEMLARLAELELRR